MIVFSSESRKNLFIFLVKIPFEEVFPRLYLVRIKTIPTLYQVLYRKSPILALCPNLNSNSEFLDNIVNANKYVFLMLDYCIAFRIRFGFPKIRTLKTCLRTAF
jgi:hypothetical protein